MSEALKVIQQLKPSPLGHNEIICFYDFHLQKHSWKKSLQMIRGIFLEKFQTFSWFFFRIISLISIDLFLKDNSFLN